MRTASPSGVVTSPRDVVSLWNCSRSGASAGSNGGLHAAGREERQPTPADAAIPAPLTLRTLLLPVGEVEEIEPVYIGDPERDGIDIAELETALMGLED